MTFNGGSCDHDLVMQRLNILRPGTNILRPGTDGRQYGRSPRAYVSKGPKILRVYGIYRNKINLSKKY